MGGNLELQRYASVQNQSISRAVAYTEKRINKSGVTNGSKIVTLIELHEPIPEPMTTFEVLRGIIIMTFAIFFLTASGILLKYHYTINPRVTVNDMVFVRAFS